MGNVLNSRISNPEFKLNPPHFSSQFYLQHDSDDGMHEDKQVEDEDQFLNDVYDVFLTFSGLLLCF